jgi:cob(I)alamin adenosyltransferase
MVRLTRIYTKGGDKGETSLGDGARVAKHDPRVAAYGTVDEANATIGLARARPMPFSAGCRTTSSTWAPIFAGRKATSPRSTRRCG